MGCILPEAVPCAKGWLLHCLEICSRSARARDYLQGLRNEIEKLGPEYRGLEQVIDSHLISRVVVGKGAIDKRRRIREHLAADWFDAESLDRFFPQFPLARIYAEGLLKALETSLARKKPLPITSWWLPDHADVKMLTLADSDAVVLLVLTPRPPAAARVAPALMRRIILGDAEAWNGLRRVRDLGVEASRKGEDASLAA